MALPLCLQDEATHTYTWNRCVSERVCLTGSLPGCVWCKMFLCDCELVCMCMYIYEGRNLCMCVTLCVCVCVCPFVCLFLCLCVCVCVDDCLVARMSMWCVHKSCCLWLRRAGIYFHTLTFSTTLPGSHSGLWCSAGA